MATAPSGYEGLVAGTQESTFEMECPHCHRRFEAEPLPVGRAARYHGFKCPHCNLFVPNARVDATEPLSRDSDA